MTDSKTAGSPKYFENVFKLAYLEFHGPDVFQTELPKIQVVKQTPGLIAESYQNYMGGLGRIQETIRQAGETGRIESTSLHKKNGLVCLIVTAFPCSMKEVPERIAVNSDNQERGYLDLLRVVLSQRPAKQLTHWTHLLVCLGDGSLHIATGTYGGWIKRERIFVFPAALVNEQDKRRLTPSAVGLQPQVR